jgi:hypothetical protein
LLILFWLGMAFFAGCKVAGNPIVPCIIMAKHSFLQGEDRFQRRIPLEDPLFSGEVW